MTKPKPKEPHRTAAELEVAVMLEAQATCEHNWRQESPVALPSTPIAQQRLFASHQARICLRCGSVHTRLWMVHGVATEWVWPVI